MSNRPSSKTSAPASSRCSEPQIQTPRTLRRTPMAQILVVDDSSTVRDEVAGFLKRNGLDVATAVDGKDGLAKLRGDPKVKLVVSDVNMPNMDGLTMAEKIRSELNNKTVNIVMLTTENSP